MAYARDLGHRRQHLGLPVFDYHGVLQLLAHGESGHSIDHELCSPDHRSNSHYQSDILPGLGKESLYWTSDRNQHRMSKLFRASERSSF